MITHEDYDSHTTKIDKNYKLPENIDSVSFSHDGGRVYIYINGQEVFKSYTGTRDCEITLDRQEG